MTKIEQKAKLSSLSNKLAFPLLLCFVSPITWAQQVAVADTASKEETEASKEEPVAVSSSEDSAAELAKKLANPVASLISVPIQYTFTDGIGPAEASQNKLIVQPVTPVSINNDWNMIVRTIVPLYIDQQSPTIGGQDASGFGDILQSFFFSPKALTESGWVWAVGPVFNYATASNEAVGSGKWSAGPTALALKQKNGSTVGILANQLWSFAGSDNQSDVNAMFLQPFFAHTTKKYTTYGINTQSTYNWETNEWTIPIYLQVSQLVKINKKPVSFQFSYINYVEAPEYGPDWGLQFTVTLLYPK